eukprot:CFRG0549T1
MAEKTRRIRRETIQCIQNTAAIYAALADRGVVHDEPHLNLQFDSIFLDSVTVDPPQDTASGSTFKHKQENSEKLLERYKLRQALEKSGLRRSDPRLYTVFQWLDSSSNTVSLYDLEDMCFQNELVERTLKGKLVIKDFETFTNRISKLYHDTRPIKDGQVASYIPQLASVDPELYGVALCTTDGQRFGIGDFNVPFSVQSCAKVATYCIAQTKLGPDMVHTYIGKEPSGQAFNKLVLDEGDRPHNPFINAGAIMATALLNPVDDSAGTFDEAMSVWFDLCGFSRRRYRNGTLSQHMGAEQPPQFSNSTYLSEQATSYRNTCLTYMMKEAGSFPEWVDNQHDITSVIECYLQFCSIECTADALSMFAATLANGGTCPTTLKTVFHANVVRNALSLMTTCGMYDASGQFAFEIGFPCKSGVGGGLLIVIPGVAGFATFSPRLDSCGNSVRGVAFCKALVKTFSVHQFESQGQTSVQHFHLQHQVANVEDERAQLLWAAYRNDIRFVKQIIARGGTVRHADYDGRTALHLAASEGYLDMVKLLVEKGATVQQSSEDRYGNTPIDDAMRANQAQVVSYLKEHYEHGKGDDGPGNMGRTIKTLEGTVVIEGLDPKGVLHDLWASGITRNDLRLKDYMSTIEDIELSKPVASKDLEDLYSVPVITKAIRGELVIPGWDRWVRDITRFFDEATAFAHSRQEQPSQGTNALRNVDPKLSGLSVCTVDGQVLSLGDKETLFTMQACMNPITYGIALETLGSEEVHQHVGCEPSGQLFDALVLDERPVAKGRSPMPHNAMVASGAIRVCALLAQGMCAADTAESALTYFERLAGGHECRWDKDESQQGSRMRARNQCMAYMMWDAGSLASEEDALKALDLYYRMCSVQLDVQALGCIAGSLANGGVCPVTGDAVFSPMVVRQVLAVMSSCGLYDLSGRFAFDFGFPCKGGISGATIMVLPGVAGIAMYSPKLGVHRMSTGAFMFCKKLSDEYIVHNLLIARNHSIGSFSSSQRRDPTEYRSIVEEQICNNIVRAAATGDIPGIRRLFRRGSQVSHLADYDGRTPLHLCCAEGHMNVLKYLLHKSPGMPLSPKDRWGRTPLLEAEANGHTNVAAMLKEAIDARMHA